MAEAKKGNMTTSLEEFITSYEWNDVELLYLLDTLRSGHSHFPFSISPAEDNQEGLLIYEPTGDGLRFTTESTKDLIPKIEKLHFQGEPYDSYLNWKNAVEKKDEVDKIYVESEESQHTEYFDNCLAVFQGGGCKAVAYVGAYDVAYKRGVIFNELAGTSAGSMIAALIAAGATPNDLRRILYDIFIKKTISFTKYPCLYWVLSFLVFILSPVLLIFWLCNKTIRTHYFKIPFVTLVKKRGMFPMNALQNYIEKELQSLTGLQRTVLFKDINPSLYIVSSDLETNTEKIWSKTHTLNESVAKAVCASCAFPFFFQPIDNQYIDGGLLSNSPNHIFDKHATYNRVLSFKLQSLPKKEKGFFSYLGKIASTVVDGAVSLQASIGHNAYYPITININMELDAMDFKKITSKTMPLIIAWGQKSTEDFFKQYDNCNEDALFTAKKSAYMIDSEEKMYSLVASYSREKKASEIHISTQDSTWAWILFPTLLKWRMEKTKVIVYLPKIIKQRKTQKKYEDARRRLLKYMGCIIKEEPKDNDILGFFSRSDNSWSGISYIEHANPEDHGRTRVFKEGQFYNGTIESKVIKTWVEKLRISQPESNSFKTNTDGLFSISLCSEKKVQEILKSNKPYDDTTVQIFYQEIDIKDIYFLSNFIRLEKYRQINVFFDMYKKNRLPLFEPVNLKLLENKSTIVTPIIVEEHKGKLYVIEGKTRLKYAYQHGMTKLKVFVITGVQKELPLGKEFEPKTVSQIMVTDNKKAENLQCIQLYRHIEEMFHPSETYLLEK